MELFSIILTINELTPKNRLEDGRQETEETEGPGDLGIESINPSTHQLTYRMKTED